MSLPNLNHQQNPKTIQDLKGFGGKSGHNVKMLHDSVLPLFKQ
jgi:hypothetical protein